MARKRNPDLRSFRGTSPDELGDYDLDVYENQLQRQSNALPTSQEKKDALGHFMRRHHRRHAVYVEGGDYTSLNQGAEAYYIPDLERTVFTGNNQQSGQLNAVIELLNEQNLKYQHAYVFENTVGRSSDYETPLYRMIMEEQGALIDSYKHPSKDADILLLSDTGYDQLAQFAR